MGIVLSGLEAYWNASSSYTQFTNLGQIDFDTGITTYVQGQVYTFTITSYSRPAFDSAGVKPGDYITNDNVTNIFATIEAINGYTLTVRAHMNVTDTSPPQWTGENIVRNTWANLSPSTQGKHNITFNGASTTGTDVDGSYISFDGNDFGVLSDVQFTGNYTVEAIIKQSSNNGTLGTYILADYVNGSGFYVSNSNGYAYLLNNGSYNIGQPYIGDNVLASVAWTVDVATKTVKVYLNGVYKGSAVIPNVWDFSSIIDWGIGDYAVYQPSANSFKGKIYALRIYNRSLSASEVTQNYNVKTAIGIDVTHNSVPLSGTGASAVNASAVVRRKNRMIPSYISANVNTSAVVRRKNRLIPSFVSANVTGSSIVRRKNKMIPGFVGASVGASAVVRRKNRMIPGYVSASVTGSSAMRRRNRLTPNFIGANVASSGSAKAFKKTAGTTTASVLTSGTMSVSGHVTNPVALSGTSASAVSTSGVLKQIHRLIPSFVSASVSTSAFFRRKKIMIPGFVSASVISPSSFFRRKSRLIPGFTSASVTASAFIGKRYKLMPGFIGAIVTSSGSAKAFKKTAGITTASMTTSGDLTVTKHISNPVPIAGSSSSSVTTGSAKVRLRKRLSGSATSGVNTSAVIKRKNRLIPVFTSASTTSTGVAKVRRRIAGTSSSNITTAGLNKTKRSVKGSSVSSITVIPIPAKLRKQVTGLATSNTSAGQGLLSVIRKGGLGGSTQANVNAKGSMYVKRKLSGSSVSSSNTSAIKAHFRRLISGKSNSTSTSSGTHRLRRRIIGIGILSVNTSATVSRRKSITGSSLSTAKSQTALLKKHSVLHASEAFNVRSYSSLGFIRYVKGNPSYSIVTASGTIANAVIHYIDSTQLVGLRRTVTKLRGEG